jgi:glycine cleavage system aminomethyltransferase T
MSLADDVAAVRTGVTLIAADHVACVRVAGPGAHPLVDRVAPRELFIRAGQMLQTLLLDDDATPLADVYIACDDDDYLIVGEGLTGPALAAYLARHAAGLDVAITDLSASHGVLGLDGPYAWELLAEIASPDVIGLPYLGFFHEGRFTCFRGGKTGEYGYELLIERDRLPAVRGLIEDAGRRFALRPIGLAALERCSLECGFFNVRREVRPGLTPVELQLQWRVSADRSFPGAAALAARRAAPGRRVTMVAGAAGLADDDVIELGGRTVGTVLHGGESFTRGEWLGVALLDRAIAHPGLTGLLGRGTVPLRTVSAPANLMSRTAAPAAGTCPGRASPSRDAADRRTGCGC